MHFVWHLLYTQNVSKIEMTNRTRRFIHALGMTMVFCAKSLGFISFIGVIGFVGGYEKQGSTESLMLAIICLAVMGAVMAISKLIPCLCSSIAKWAFINAYEARAARDFRKGRRYSRILEVAVILSDGI